MNFITDINLRTNDPLEAAILVKRELRKNKIIKIIPEFYLGNLRDFYEVLTENLGKTILIGEDFENEGIQTNEKWLEIRYDADIPDLAAYRHSKNAQPLHTDESYIKNPADIMFFYGVNKAVKGGATTFIDGPVLIEYMKENAPDLLERLMNTNVRYKKSGEERIEKIIDIKEDGAIHFNYNYYCIDEGETEGNKKLNKDFFDFLENHVSTSDMIEQVLLNPGESVLWWDELVLHGRTSYEASKTNDRFIWKTGFKWKE